MCQTRLKLSWKVNECKPLELGEDTYWRGVGAKGNAWAVLFYNTGLRDKSGALMPARGRGLHSSTIRLYVSTFCGMRWVHDVPPVY